MLPSLQLSTPDGAAAEVFEHGAHVASWKPAGDSERLFLSGSSIFREGTAIRGGVPVIFPQFAAEGPLPKHGFARTLNWRLLGRTQDSVALALEDSEATRAIWPHSFACELIVRLAAQRLSIDLAVTNRGDAAFAFTAALHTYLRVDDIAAARVSGLKGLRYRDSAKGGAERSEADEPVAIAGEVDRIYFDAPAELELIEPARRLRVLQEGFTDTVVWNPGADKGAALSDLEAGGYRRMLCIEAAVVGRPVELAPGAHWRGSQTLVAV
jgi:glucose-6-phosphate 1-epimerase